MFFCFCFLTRFTQVVGYSRKGIFLFAVHGVVQAVSVAGEVLPFLLSLTEYSRVFLRIDAPENRACSL